MDISVFLDTPHSQSSLILSLSPPASFYLTLLSFSLMWKVFGLGVAIILQKVKSLPTIPTFHTHASENLGASFPVQLSAKSAKQH